jgi:cysteine desulfurase
VRGLAKANEKKGRHIITSAIEHFSVLYPMQQLEKEGFKVTYIPVDNYGLVDPKAIEAAITPQTILISITHASNEIGTIEPIAEIAKISRAKGVLFHVDGVQTIGNIPVNVVELGVDAMSFAANMFYGPTGIAGLYVRGAVRILPFMLGGTQEEGRRAGSVNIPGVVGMGRAAELAKMEMQDRMGEMIPLRDKLLNELPLRIKDFNITGHPTLRLPGHASGHAKFVEGESLSMFLNMEGIAVSTGSACASKALKASHVLLAIGISESDVHGSLVFSIGKGAVEQDIDLVLEKLPPIVERLRAMSPMR